MKKSHLLVSCAVAGLLMGSQAAMADHHEESKTKDGKAGCKGKDTCKSKDGKDTCHSKEGKASCKTKDGKASCGANGCDSKEE